MDAQYYPDRVAIPRGTVICQVASSNYVGMYGVGEPGVEGEGLFYRDSSVTLRDIADGLTQTIAVGERSHLLGQATWVGSVSGAALGPPPGWNGSVGRFRIEPGSSMTLGHTGEGKTPGDRTADCNQFYSRHGPGVNFLFMDGRVAFLKTVMDYRVFRAMSTPPETRRSRWIIDGSRFRRIDSSVRDARPSRKRE